MGLQEITVSPQPAFSPCRVSWERGYGWALPGDSRDQTGELIFPGLAVAHTSGPGNGDAGKIETESGPARNSHGPGPGGRTTGLRSCSATLFLIVLGPSRTTLEPLYPHLWNDVH